MRVKPGGLTAVCIMAIVLGGLGLMSCFAGVAGMVFGEKIQAAAEAGNPDKVDDAIKTMQTKIYAVSQRWRPVQIALLVLQVMLTGGLLLGGILGLQLKPLGRKLLAMAFWGAILFEIVRLIPTVAIQMETIPILQDMMNEARPQENAAPGNAFAAIMMASVVAGLAFAVIWFLIKMAMFLWGALYLRKPEIVELFKPEDPFAAQDPYTVPGFGR